MAWFRFARLRPRLLGMLAGEAGVQWIKGSTNVVQSCLHQKSFAVLATDEARKNRDAI